MRNKNYYLLLSIIVMLSACNRNPGNATVTVDTLVTDEVETEALYKATSMEFEGVMPCADCPGITTHLHLNKDSMTFYLTEIYQGKADSVFTRSGIYRMITGSDSVSNIIEIAAAKEAPPRYFEYSGDTMLYCLDKNAQRISNDAIHVLRKKLE